MSADNWAVCPRCIKMAYEKAVADFKTTFGYTPPKEQILVEPKNCHTFREDYEIDGAEEGEVVVYYKGHCSNCQLRLEFNVSRKLEF